MIPAAVVEAFGLRGDPVALDGGAGTSVLLDGAVCKPTDDPAVLAQRREAREAQNREWGRILSNTAPEADVRAFVAALGDVLAGA